MKPEDLIVGETYQCTLPENVRLNSLSSITFGPKPRGAFPVVVLEKPVFDESYGRWSCDVLSSGERFIADPSWLQREVFTPDQVAALHKYQFGPFDSPMNRFHPFTCPNRGDGRHFDNGADLGALIPTTRGWICQCCEYTQTWAHDFMKGGK